MCKEWVLEIVTYFPNLKDYVAIINQYHFVKEHLVNCKKKRYCIRGSWYSSFFFSETN